MSERLTDLNTPCALVDLDRLSRNLDRMADLAREAGVALRPHAKTHKTVEIARRQLERGAVGVTVATLGEAEALADGGIADIRVARPVVGGPGAARLLSLSRQANLSAIVDSAAGAEALSAAFAGAGRRLDVLLKVDVGLGRCGLPPSSPQGVALARRLVELPGLDFRGLLTHAGQAYGAGSSAEVTDIGRQEGELMVAFADELRAEGIEVAEVSVGSTPTVPYSARVAGVTEIRPGNYVFYDRIQVSLGAATLDDCALTVLGSVISRPASDRAVLDTGSKALGLDMGAHGRQGVVGHGQVLIGLTGMAPLDGVVIESLSEEHGVAQTPPEAQLEVGQRVRVAPNHACPVANYFSRLAVVRGERVLDWWPVVGRR